ncbi:hydrogen peroxide-inducible genes activator [Variibacter gotjawalensis]|uniref:Hydrogen peroxide-inducible genes activator n=1 Tax=Variibacter gotjawalensis TaxID=1333996 RepID=A0A0S3PVC0_9BRAD|nr:hydrogen peroxide-inducible genes activator [Variibacter gotjawalensis]NIK50181.1 LysR family hydrogen peroxide-inducible transcriptional activator [Variibacter gotjawalensis]RZS46178.1 LysR family transcriptional regulator [Variibacter gotjawalensis]BAT59853.1 hydrogen peroxide-inducible genes activator [Variibacter gotjawalensis]
MVTIRQLTYFDALARHRHFGRAAEACAVTQPALSMQIRDLERSLGAQLVERRPGDVVITAVGKEVARRAGEILNATRDLADAARHHARVLTGPLRLGIIPSLAPYVLPRLLPALQAGHSDLRLELQETQTKTLLTRLGRGELDAAMLALPVDDPELETRALFEDRFLLALPADDPLAARDSVQARDIDRHNLILLEEGHCLRDQTLAFCAMARDRASPGLGATSLATVMQMVANNYGVTLVPEIAAPIEVRNEQVKLVRFADPEPGRTIGLVWRSGSARKTDFEALAEIARGSVG